MVENFQCGEYMDYKIQTPQKGDYVLVKVYGDVTIGMASEFARNATDEGLKAGINKMLVDVRGYRSATKVLDEYRFAHGKAEKVGISRAWIICILCDVGDESFTFLETVMRNAGYNYQVVFDERNALDWLNSGYSRSPYHFGYQ